MSSPWMVVTLFRPNMKPELSKLAKLSFIYFTGYAMRTGGTTHMEVSGVAEPVRKAMGEWMSLGTARHYLQHLPKDQFGILQPAMA